MSKTCGGSILPQRLPELGNTDSEIINSDYMILPALVCSARLLQFAVTAFRTLVLIDFAAIHNRNSSLYVRR